MKPATAPRRPSKLLSIAADHSSVHPLNDLPLLVKPGDVWVVNDAATFPASLHGRTETGAEIELRLFPHPPSSTRPWSAVLFGAGNWRTKTEDRLAPPSLRMGERIYFENDSVSIRGISVLSPRLLEINFERSEFETWQFIYRIGKPIQYSGLGNAIGGISAHVESSARS
jgi:S-adenosylmethionine:tRNA ribosyltransferase-isomerase